MSNRIFGVLAVVALAAGLFAIFGTSGDEPEGTSARPPTAASAPAARVEVAPVALPQSDGGKFASATFRGKSPVVISFFATW